MSSPWNGTLEALHSALIDELIEIFPRARPILGLPTRHAAWTLPLGASLVVSCELKLGNDTGAASISLNPEALSLLSQSKRKLTADALIARTIQRANPDLERREIVVAFDTPKEVQVKSYPNSQLVIWIPLSIEDSHFTLGLTRFR